MMTCFDASNSNNHANGPVQFSHGKKKRKKSLSADTEKFDNHLLFIEKDADSYARPSLSKMKMTDRSPHAPTGKDSEKNGANDHTSMSVDGHDDDDDDDDVFIGNQVTQAEVKMMRKRLLGKRRQTMLLYDSFGTFKPLSSPPRSSCEQLQEQPCAALKEILSPPLEAYSVAENSLSAAPPSSIVIAAQDLVETIESNDAIDNGIGSVMLTEATVTVQAQISSPMTDLSLVAKPLVQLAMDMEDEKTVTIVAASPVPAPVMNEDDDQADHDNDDHVDNDQDHGRSHGHGHSHSHSHNVPIVTETMSPIANPELTSLVSLHPLQLSKLTLKNTKQNSGYSSVQLVYETVVLHDTPRPPSPSTKVKKADKKRKAPDANDPEHEATPSEEHIVSSSSSQPHRKMHIRWASQLEQEPSAVHATHRRSSSSLKSIVKKSKESGSSSRKLSKTKSDQETVSTVKVSRFLYADDDEARRLALLGPGYKRSVAWTESTLSTLTETKKHAHAHAPALQQSKALAQSQTQTQTQTQTSAPSQTPSSLLSSQLASTKRTSKGGALSQPPQRKTK